MSRTANRHLPAPPTEPYRSGTHVRLLVAAKCCGPTSVPSVTGLTTTQRAFDPIWIQPNNLGVIYKSTKVQTVHDEHHQNPNHHVNEDAQFLYELSFTIPTKIDYEQIFPRGKKAFMVPHTSLLAQGRLVSSTIRFKSGDYAKTKVLVTLGEGATLCTLPIGTRVQIAAKAVSSNGGTISDPLNVVYEVKVHHTYTHNIVYTSNKLLKSQFALST